MATIGIDLGGTKAYALRFDKGVVQDEERVLLERQGNTVGAIAAAIRRLMSPDLQAVGIGVAGLVDQIKGTFAWGPHVAERALPLRSLIESEFGVPVAIDNDCNTALVAELRSGAAAADNGKENRNILMITLGTGIGGAVAIGGKLYRGTSHAGEWGHMRVDPKGSLCACGAQGCWETKASGPALARLGMAAGSLPNTAEGIVQAASDGDDKARAVVARVGHEFGLGLANLVAIFDPDLLIVGGGLGCVGDILLDPAREALASALHGKDHRSPPPIRMAALGQAAGALGAALLAEELLLP